MPTPEGKVVAAVKKAVKEAGGEVRKLEWVNRSGAPDLFVMLNGMHGWVECKAPGKKPRGNQVREFDRMGSIGGCIVMVVDSVETAAYVPWALEKMWAGETDGVLREEQGHA